LDHLVLKLQKYKVAAVVVLIHTRLVLILGNLVDLAVVAVTNLAHNPVESEITLAALHVRDILAVMVVLLQHTTVVVAVVPVVLVLLLVLEPSVVLVDLGVRYGLLNHHQLQQYKHL
tara:strand:+ start:177 stop:527 length:351 start_codon:yes stop_codon:yes gene_type:complete